MENIVDVKAKIIENIRKGSDGMVLNDIEKVLKDLSKAKDRDEEIYRYFTQIYDEIFHDLLFEKIKIEHNTKKLLEMLALPVNTRTLIMKEKIVKKNFKWKA
ncbi:MAG: hypothetical protein ACD_3C00058G0009 [uncultured bacterium (gcode 4)]|uniref:VLIG-type G domain-containing protein n=1 Tax=uncultured bacterium (gcode 4) TaxID=1234023 RepID=K2FZQ1_9BACT|nr:MAG: hypothetical protein ACD_3C00058G0009 [uncultured bacterium (gcode 4)]